uniref:Reverse transcriptase domain-containing protein n=1 Tax=Micrurus lemniscatus lemniscatus TaxID=129467 RepID=A0A2D4I1F2_MICLE
MNLKNYRSISLLNSGYKIFASITAEQLKRFLSQFIHSDQNGFLPKRQIKDNMRIISNTLEYYETHPEKQMVLIFLDAQKAFVNVNWQFVLAQLKVMDFRERFIKMIKAIYYKQTARVMLNGDKTEKVNIKKGTIQGCPLSPLLFVLTLEVLNSNIRQDEEIKGMEIKKGKI